MYRKLSGDVTPRLLLVWAVLLIVALGGGSSWPDTVSLLYVRPALVMLAATALTFYAAPLRKLRVFAWLLGALAIWIALQLVPLPPSIWMRLPGHDLIARIGTAAGVPAMWRPISISPDATLNSLLACIPAAAAIAVVATLDGRGRRSLVGPLLVLVVAAMLLGASQLASGGNGALLLYRRSDEDTAVGLFANRNHFALLLASGLPLLGAWASGRAAKAEDGIDPVRLFLAGVCALFLLVMIIATGSRAGLALGVMGGVAGAAICWRNIGLRAVPPRAARRRLLLVAGCVAAALLVLAATVALKGLAVERAVGTFGNLGAEKRATLTPVMLAALGLYFPFGSGFGTFDRMFRQIEPDWALTPTYFNHAHNEALELILTGGLPALLIATAFVVLVARLAWRAVMLDASAAAARAQAGVVVTLLAIAASIADYPLRTPLMDVVVVFALAMATAGGRARGSAVALDRG